MALNEQTLKLIKIHQKYTNKEKLTNHEKNLLLKKLDDEVQRLYELVDRQQILLDHYSGKDKMEDLK